MREKTFGDKQKLRNFIITTPTITERPKKDIQVKIKTW